jgi:hypothetical protein
MMRRDGILVSKPSIETHAQVGVTSPEDGRGNGRRLIIPKIILRIWQLGFVVNITGEMLNDARLTGRNLGVFHGFMWMNWGLIQLSYLGRQFACSALLFVCGLGLDKLSEGRNISCV